MANIEEESTVPAFRFKRRKVNHPKRVRVDDDDAPTTLADQPANTDAAPDAPSLAKEPQEEEDSTPNLREILRNRKRPRDRLRDVVRKAETPRTELVEVDAPAPDRYTSRFVSQTGHVVDKDDKQMTEYVEARLAEKNYRQYGWPIPKHLQSTVAAIAPDLRHTFSTQSEQTAAERTSTADTIARENPEHGNRIAAGMGKLQEVDLGPDAAARSQKAWNQLQGGPSEKESKVRLGRDGKPRRQPKRRNSDDIRRDQMVEAVLRESKLEYFDETPLANTRFAGTEEDMVEQFRTEYFESMESRQQRAPAAPPGGKEGPKGPKLGGSRSARAAMRLQEEQAAKSKR